MTRMFTFDPQEYAAAFAAQDYVHIPQGLSAEFYQRVCSQVAQFREAKRLDRFALGNKQQALYEFPDDADYHRQFVEALGAVAGLDPNRIVISERHIKTYEPDADPKPMPHKDRFATQLAVGFTIHNPRSSHLVIYPDADRSVNPFNSWAELRASLPPDRLPPAVLQGARRVEVHDRPRDVMIFRGNEIWHTRENGADTVMLYFKVNAFHCDPIGEDVRADEFRRLTLERAAAPGSLFETFIPVLGRRVDYVQRRYNSLWQEVLGVVLCGEPHYTIDEDELALLRAMNGKHTVGELLRRVIEPERHAAAATKLRRLAQRGVIDLLTESSYAPPAVATPELAVTV